jgi:hypothetical protein
MHWQILSDVGEIMLAGDFLFESCHTELADKAPDMIQKMPTLRDAA